MKKSVTEKQKEISEEEKFHYPLFWQKTTSHHFTERGGALAIAVLFISIYFPQPKSMEMNR